MFNMIEPLLCFIIRLYLKYCCTNIYKYCIMVNLYISTNFIVPLLAMPRSHIHGSPRRFYYGLNLKDNQGNANFSSPIWMHYIRMIKETRSATMNSFRIFLLSF